MLVLVIGPSGAGKDTLLLRAQAALAGDDRFRFVRRVITRPVGVDAEQHEPSDPEAFEARRAAGRFALSWKAHGFDYGIPVEIADDIAARRIVVASVSRTCIGQARAQFPIRVVEITAPAELLARRLALRGREDAVAVAGRLARTISLPSDLRKDTIVNDGTIDQGARKLVALLTRAAEAAREG